MAIETHNRVVYEGEPTRQEERRQSTTVAKGGAAPAMFAGLDLSYRQRTPSVFSGRVFFSPCILPRNPHGPRAGGFPYPPALPNLALISMPGSLSLDVVMTEQRMASPADKPVPAKNGEAPLSHGDVAAINDLRASYKKMRDELSRTIIGQSEVIERLLICVLARGHGLLMGVPGLAKTTIVNCISQVMSLQFNRIQFTPDLMPSDITGTDILQETEEPGRRAFVFAKGPVFANIILADEINRTPPKTQSALLEAMQEHRVTVAGRVFPLPSPFFVLATQNPIEQEGTYPLPEAQLDRFMFCIHLGYPGAAEEQQVILDTTRDAPTSVGRVLNAAQVIELQQLVRRVPVSQHVALYALSLIRATRPGGEGALDFVNRWVHWGAGTRAGQYLLLAAKTHVLLQGRFSVSCADVREYALPVLRHRIFPTFTAASEGVDTDQIVKKIVAAVKEPQY